MKAVDSLGKSYDIIQSGNEYIVKKDSIIPGAEYIDIIDDSFFAMAGEEGYYVIADWATSGSRLCRFNDKPDGERIFNQVLMPIFGIKKSDRVALVIVKGYRFKFNIVYGVKDKEYYIYPKFMLNGDAPYEDISLSVIELDKDAGYSEMAKAYRKYQFETGACAPLVDKLKNRPELDYALNSPEIRIRLGWKPVPCSVLHQTAESEPEMKVVCDFDRVCDIIDELKNQGVDKAQLCLVGWNISGHDGRYPQIFPVEDKLGGEERLRHLIDYAQKNGYQIVCHTNSTDCYTIAEDFSEDIVVKDREGQLSVNSDFWSGGRMYNLCPVKAEEYAERDLPKVRELGFRGLHYIDVMTVVPIRHCYDKNHPSNPSQTVEAFNRIMELCHREFGGFASEGSSDFAAKHLDYGLYVAFPAKEDDMYDCEIPLWELVYHGSILYNITPDTTNYTIKEKDKGLKVVEYGGRPAIYFYSRHIDSGDHADWLGKVDMMCDTDEQLRYSVSKIKEAYDEYKALMHLQTEFMESHREVAENVFEIKYSDGTVVNVDYNRLTYSVNR